MAQPTDHIGKQVQEDGVYVLLSMGFPVCCWWTAAIHTHVVALRNLIVNCTQSSHWLATAKMLGGCGCVCWP